MVVAGMGLADVTEQKDASNNKLDENVKCALATLESLLEVQVKHQRDYLYAQADKQKKQIDEQVEMEVKQQEMALKKQYAAHTMALKKQAAREKAALEQEAMKLSMEYQRKKFTEDMMKS